VGVGTVPFGMEIADDTAIRAVDAALYRAKEEGRDRVSSVIMEDFLGKLVGL